MKPVTRLIALLLTLALCVGCVPMAAAQEEETARLEGMSGRYEGTNDFGRLLAVELQGDFDQEDPTWVSDIKVEEGIAHVTVNAERDVLLLIGAYDENSGALLTSATVSAGSLDSEVSVALPELPAFYELKVFVLEPESYEPLCGAYTSTYYTSAMQALMSKTVADFPQEQVLKLEESDTTNFAVFATGTVQAAESLHQNRLDRQENGVYTFRDPSYTMQNLEVGQVLAFTTLEGELLIIKVADVSGGGRSLTVEAATEELKIEEVFDYVKINTDMPTDQAVVDDSDMDEGVTFEGVEGPDTRAAHGQWEHESTFKFGMKDFEIVDGLKLSFTVGLTFGAQLEYYLAVGENSFVRLELSYKLGAEFSVEAELAEKAIKLAEIAVVPIFGVKFLVRPYFVISAKAKITASLTYSSSGGYVVSVRGGKIDGQKLYSKPKTESKIEAEGTVFVGLRMVPAISIVTEGLADVSMEFTAGVELNAKTVGLKCDPSNDKHQCQLCIDGVLRVRVQIDINLRMLYVFYLDVNLLKYERYLADFYYSFDLNEFGFGICPNDKGSAHSLISGQECLQAGNCGDLNWFFYDNGTLYIRGTGTMKTPDEWEDLAEQVIYVIVESGAENISEKAFYGFSKLDTVELPETVELIDEYAFCGCSSLMEVELPDGLVSLGAYAFGHCHSLASVTVGSQLESVSNCAFRRCYALTDISFPTGLETIGTRAFEDCTSLRSVDLPMTLVNLGDGAFTRCSALEEIYLPDRLENMGEECFYFCTSLTDAYVGGSIGDLPDSTFYACQALTRLELAEGITAIGQAAFWDCDSLITVNIPGSVKILEKYAFMSCESLENIGLNSGLEEIRGEAFRNCSSLQAVYMPHTVTTVSLRAFEACSSLRTVRFSESLEAVGRMSFYECSALESVDLPDSVTTVEEDAFAYCTGIVTVDLGDGVTTLENASFYGCEALERIRFSPVLETIGDGSFWFCGKLTSVDLPDGLTELGAYAFQACEALSEIDLGQSLEILGGWSLKGTAVRSVTVPATVTTVGNCAFAECELLDTVTFMGDAPSFGRQTFSETETVAYYPSNRSGWTAEVLQDYEGTVTWIPFEAPAASQSAPARRQGEKAGEMSVSGLSNSARYLLVVAHSLEEPLLTRENLIYAEQLVSYADGTLTVRWQLPQSVETACVALYGEDGVTVLQSADREPCDGGENCPCRVFTDVNPAIWYHEGIDFALNNGLFNGMSATTFAPDSPMTRAMLVTVLWRYAGSPAGGNGSFSDVPGGIWYSTAVAWASSEGVVNGVGGGRFDPDGTVTREQMATILYRYSLSLGIDASQQADLSSFPDSGKVSGYALAPLAWAVAEGLITGTQKGGQVYLDPQGSATRAQVATILMRYIYNVVEG